MFFKRGRNQAQKNYRAALIKLATSPAALNVSMLMDDARSNLEQYLNAYYRQQVDLLPTGGMEEAFYYETIRNIHKENIGGDTEISLGDFELCDYDRSVMYMVQKILYRTSFDIKGKNIKSGRKEILATYQYDERLGWLLSGVQPYLNEKDAYFFN